LHGFALAWQTHFPAAIEQGWLREAAISQTDHDRPYLFFTVADQAALALALAVSCNTAFAPTIV